MAAAIEALIGALAFLMETSAGRALLGLGITFLSYTGLNIGFASLRSLVISNFNGLSTDVLNMMGFLGLDKAITIILSGFAYKISLNAIGGTIKKMVAK